MTDLTRSLTDDIAAWRSNRQPGWYRDYGYALQQVIYSHRYDYDNKGSKPDDPGWHACTCGWEGYWCDFQPHVTDHLRAVVSARAEALAAQWDQAARSHRGEGIAYTASSGTASVLTACASSLRAAFNESSEAGR